jgi:hypothetical protein
MCHRGLGFNLAAAQIFGRGVSCWLGSTQFLIVMTILGCDKLVTVDNQKDSPAKEKGQMLQWATSQSTNMGVGFRTRRMNFSLRKCTAGHLQNN